MPETQGIALTAGKTGAMRFPGISALGSSLNMTKVLEEEWPFDRCSGLQIVLYY